METVHTGGELSLLQWQRRFPGGKVPFEQAVFVLRRLAEVLHRVHFERPFHRDVIPSTVVVRDNPDGTDSFEVPELGAALESHGEIGARRYLAPEQWWGARQNSATDQYALAVLFVELVTGSVPFAAAFETEDETVMRTAVCEHPPKLPEDCPQRDVLIKALSKDPRARFRSCSSFVAALSSSPSQSVSSRDESAISATPHHRRRPARQKRLSKLKIAVLLFGICGCFYWGCRSGLIKLPDGSRDAARVRRMETMQALRAEESEAANRNREAMLSEIRTEIERQEIAAAQALEKLQAFLESGGAAVLAVRRESLEQARRKARQNLSKLEDEVSRDRLQEQALTALRTRSIAYESIAKDIPAESEVAIAYKSLAAEAVKLDELSGKFTKKHPSVMAQQNLMQTARTRFFDSVDRAVKQVRATLESRQGLLENLRAEADAARQKFEEIERDWHVAQLKQEELSRVREREANRLAELRRRAVDVRFGTDAVVTNSPFSR